ncbi:MAG: tyrosine-type recombinase/integrase [Paracoccaceae bacterium]|nr:tyrosine-type recombinase/integrase [Paracoccaceae bacterium]
MGKLARHMHKSKDGWLSYRRRIPETLRPLFNNKREIKHAYKTKIEVIALKQHALFHSEVEKEFTEAKAMMKNLVPPKQETKFQTPSKLFLEVYNELKAMGFLPHQMSSSNVTMSEEERMAWNAMDSAWSEATVLHDYDAITSQENHERMNKLNLSEPFKKFAQHRDWIRYLEEEGEGEGLPDKGKMQLRILKGDYKSPDPNIEDLFNHYVDAKRSETRQGSRNQKQQIKLENSIKRIVDLIASAHPNGSETLISQLEMGSIKIAFENKYPRIDTRKRNYSDAAAAVNLWNKYHSSKSVDNPFAKLKVEMPDKDRSKRERRVWTPEEYQRFWTAIQSEPDPSRKIMCMFMAYAGKPQGEVAGLIRDDVRIEYEVPHVLFESNDYRVLGKKRQDNMLPLVGDMLDLMQEYISTFSGGAKDLLFPSLFRMDSGSRSRAVSKYAEEIQPVDGTLFEPYGLRHTFKPRYEAADVDPIKGMYLFGHKNGLTSKTHDSYSKGVQRVVKFKKLRDDMLKIMEVKSWEYSYRISDFD